MQRQEKCLATASYSEGGLELFERTLCVFHDCFLSEDVDLTFF